MEVINNSSNSTLSDTSGSPLPARQQDFSRKGHKSQRSNQIVHHLDFIFCVDRMKGQVVSGQMLSIWIISCIRTAYGVAQTTPLQKPMAHLMKAQKASVEFLNNVWIFAESNFHLASSFQFFPFPSATLKEQNRSSFSSTIDFPGFIISGSLLGHHTDSGSRSPSSPDFIFSSLYKPFITTEPTGNTNTLSIISWSQNQWICFARDLVTVEQTNANHEAPQSLHFKTENLHTASASLLGSSSNSCASEDQSDLYNNITYHEKVFIEETDSATEISSTFSLAPLDSSLVSTCVHIHKSMASMCCVLVFA
ncbi:uncharacterized protein LOC142047019 [Chelonoidis abingdonii]|uniref:uncharacterized protein LOC142047019 n=1 Tax=Chelonoidis abingdonii TaxID=106734 RepID=UPI003F496F56